MLLTRHWYALLLAQWIETCLINGKAHWHDPNIVLVNGNWEKVPDDTWGTPHAPYDERWKKNSSTIIVLIAALRETRLPATIMSAFDNAAHPERIRVGVVQQNDDSDEDCIEAVCRQRERPLVKFGSGKTVRFENPNECVEFDKVRVFRMSASEAAGPVYARGHQPKLVEEEDFCMQIDAHTIFKKNWDLSMLHQWGQTQNEFAVLSTYPTNYKDLDKNSNNHWEMPHICGVRLQRDGAVSNHQASAAANLERPLLAPLWAAGLSFSRCHAERRVPNDVNLKQVFSGEEFSRGARLWTHGYDFYSITRPIIGVYYGSDKGGRGSWHSKHDEHRSSMERLKTLLHFPGSDQSTEAVAALGKFALGSRRTLDQYIAFSGVNTKTLQATPTCIVKYVPFDDTGLKEEIYAEEMDLRARYRHQEAVAEPNLVDIDSSAKSDVRHEGLRNSVGDIALEKRIDEAVGVLRGQGSLQAHKVGLVRAWYFIGSFIFCLAFYWGYKEYRKSRYAKGRRMQ